jgi:hypothetical protein
MTGLAALFGSGVQTVMGFSPEKALKAGVGLWLGGSLIILVLVSVVWGLRWSFRSRLTDPGTKSKLGRPQLNIPTEREGESPVLVESQPGVPNGMAETFTNESGNLPSPGRRSAYLNPDIARLRYGYVLGAVVVLSVVSTLVAIRLLDGSLPRLEERKASARLNSIIVGAEGQDEQRMMFEGERVHPGCIRELVTELDGDDIVSSVYISGTFFRGCQDSNEHSERISIGRSSAEIGYRDDETEVEFSYEVLGVFDRETYLVRTTQFVEGSMGASVEIVILRFEDSTIFQIDEGKWQEKTVTKMTKIGSLYEEDLEDFVEAYNAGQVSFDMR